MQVFDESQQLSFGFDVLDATKFIPEETVPFFPLGKLTLNRNPINYFAETEQVMFQVGHVVRGIDFSEDPLLQGRIFSYLDTQLNRHGGPNFEQIPINRPQSGVHNNERDGAAQMFIHKSKYAYTPKTFNGGAPFQANQSIGDGFFTAPGRTVSGSLRRATSPTFADVWSQPRLFYNSLNAAEQQNLINAIRFELAHITSTEVKQNTLIQLNRVSHDIALRVASAIGMMDQVPAPDTTYYHNRTTSNVSVYKAGLKSLAGLKVGILTTITNSHNFSDLRTNLEAAGMTLLVVAETIQDGVDQTYSTTGAEQFDALIVDDHTTALFLANTTSALYPADRPKNILADAYRWGKPVAAAGVGISAFTAAGVKSGPGVFVVTSVDEELGEKLQKALYQYTFWDRFPLDD